MPEIEVSDYIELSCTVCPDKQENLNILTANLDKLGFESFMDTEKGINAYIQAHKFDLGKIRNLAKKLSFYLIFTSKLIKDQNWNQEWETNYFKPIVIGSQLLVHATFHKDLPKAKQEIIIDPKTAFGTGYHATTYMIIEEILKLNLYSKEVLDMGTGTGILAILSKLRGAKSVVAVDNDEKACVNTKENIEVNNVKDIIIKVGDCSVLDKESFDVIYENIWKNTVIKDIPILYKHINPDGILITSGFYKTDVEEVRKAGENAGFKYCYCKEKDAWAIVRFEK